MPEHTPVKPGTPSKNAENQDSAVLTQSQPSTSEEVEARAGRPATVAPDYPSPRAEASSGTDSSQRDGDPLDQADQATADAVAERANLGRSHRSDGDA